MATSKSDSKCPVTRSEVDLSYYEKLDGAWRELKLSAPARRALVNAKLFKLTDLKKISLSDLKQLHGMGPTTIKALEKAGAKFKVK